MWEKEANKQRREEISHNMMKASNKKSRESKRLRGTYAPSTRRHPRRNILLPAGWFSRLRIHTRENKGPPYLWSMSACTDDHGSQTVVELRCQDNQNTKNRQCKRQRIWHVLRGGKYWHADICHGRTICGRLLQWQDKYQWDVTCLDTITQSPQYWKHTWPDRQVQWLQRLCNECDEHLLEYSQRIMHRPSWEDNTLH